MTQALKFLSLPPGDVVYHLAVLFAIEAILAMTWHHRHDGLTRRWAIASVGLTMGQLLLILAAALSALKVIASPIAITPPLERLVEVVSLGLLVWAFVPLLQDHPGAGKALALGNLIAAIILYAWAAPQWFILSNQGLAFNVTTQDRVWSAWALALSLVAMILSLARRRTAWAYSLVAFALMAAGHGLHLFVPDPQLHVAEWARLAGLAAFPLFAALVYGHMLTRQAPVTAISVAPLAVEPNPASPGLWPVVEACRALSEANDLPQTLQKAAGAIAKATQASLVAVGIPGASPDTVELIAIHHPGAAPEVNAVFPLNSQPTIQSVISAKRRATLDPLKAQGNEAVALAQLLDTPPLRPLLIEPLVYNHETLGVLIVGQSDWTVAVPPTGPLARLGDEGASLVAQSATQLAWGLGLARRAETLTRRAEELAASLRHHETRAVQERLALEAHAAENQAELRAIRAELEEARAQAMQHQKRAGEIATLVDQMQMEREHIMPPDWKEQIERLRADRARSAAEADQWRRQAESLTVLQTALQDELNQVKKSGASPEPTGPSEPQIMPLNANGASYGILVGDTQGQVIAASHEAARLLGVSCPALIGQPLAGVCADPNWNTNLESVMAEANDSTSPHAPLQFNTQAGGRTLHVELAALTTNGSAPGRVVAVLAAPNSREESENRSEVIASLSQDLRTPMTSISGYTDLLLNESAGILGAMQRQFLQRVKANIERMNGMLNDLVRVTAVDTAHFELELESVNLAEVIEESIMGSSAQFRDRNITIQVDLAEHLSPLNADRDSLYQIMSHLLANACLCSKSGTQVRVSAQQSEAEGYVVVSVTDTGGGIRLSDRQRVFSRRYRADHPLIEGLGDTSIGLSIAKTLVEAHDGRIWVDSEMGQGSTFAFVLRAAQPA